MNDKLVITIIYLWVLVCSTVQGSDIDCTDCACCVNQTCGPGIYFSNECTLGCIDGYYGARCYVKCPSNCKACISQLGVVTCTVCHEGYYDVAGDCTSECLPTCKTCTSGSTCTSCKDEYYNDIGSNDCRYRKCPGNCKCENDQCTSCMEGYYDTRKSCISSCPGNCITCSSATLCDTCKDGYYNGYQYDDSSLPLKNDCSYNCRDNCVNCSSYGFCLVCKAGHYGPGCEGKCSVGCTSGICDKEIGNCNCVAFFAGDKCDRCQQGKYGDMCDINCSIGCKDNVCERKSGNCTNRCIVDTIIGDKCDVCQTGWYGTYCNLSCSVGCNTKQCKRTNGDCAQGCINNFIGIQCDQCINGKYGQRCDKDCSFNCVEKKCLRESGNCVECLVKFTGDKCDRCVAGFYALNCSEKCPPNCLNGECDRNSGTCLNGCIDNYSGDRCCVNNKNCIHCFSDTSCDGCKLGFFEELCDQPCPQNCLDSCDFITGICAECKNNFYGERCNIPCASACKPGTKDSGSKCQRMNGDCLHGCVNGSYGFQCSAKCSNNCINSICNKDDGKCTDGCQANVVDNRVCPLVSPPGSPDQPVNITHVVLGTLLALSLVGNIILAVIFIHRQYRKRKLTRGSIYENTETEMKSKIVTKESHSRKKVSNSNITPNPRDYEDLSSIQVTEHEYGEIRTSI